MQSSGHPRVTATISLPQESWLRTTGTRKEADLLIAIAS
jgi:hypothetical protein